jgi:hypothetical protein
MPSIKSKLPIAMASNGSRFWLYLRSALKSLLIDLIRLSRLTSMESLQFLVKIS